MPESFNPAAERATRRGHCHRWFPVFPRAVGSRQQPAEGHNTGTGTAAGGGARGASHTQTPHTGGQAHLAFWELQPRFQSSLKVAPSVLAPGMPTSSLSPLPTVGRVGAGNAQNMFVGLPFLLCKRHQFSSSEISGGCSKGLLLITPRLHGPVLQLAWKHPVLALPHPTRTAALPWDKAESQ